MYDEWLDCISQVPTQAQTQLFPTNTKTFGRSRTLVHNIYRTNPDKHEVYFDVLLT